MKSIIIGLAIAFLALSSAADSTKTASAEKVSAEKKPITDIEHGSELPLAKGSMVAIKSYDSSSNTYEIYAVNFPGEGESKVTVLSLTESITSLDLELLKVNPKTIVGNQYMLDNNLPTLFVHEVEARKKRIRDLSAPLVKKKGK